jgi:mRNA deadenylase 3'-5' endonuclease subunit Ccr4
MASSSAEPEQEKELQPFPAGFVLRPVAAEAEEALADGAAVTIASFNVLASNYASTRSFRHTR